MGVLTYYHADGLGSVVKRSNHGGAIVHEYQYDAWGNVETGEAEPGYAFTGREWDPETALYYYRARYYDARSGRFLSSDPMGFKAGINHYTYAESDPVLWKDPSGLVAFQWPPPMPITPALPSRFPKPNGGCCDKAKIKEARESAQSQIDRMNAGGVPEGKLAASSATSHNCDEQGNCVPIVDDEKFFDPGIVEKGDPCVDYCTTVHEWVHFTDNRPWSTKWTDNQITRNFEYPGYVRDRECLDSYLKP